jgi:hypothetical protein
LGRDERLSEILHWRAQGVHLPVCRQLASNHINFNNQLRKYDDSDNALIRLNSRLSLLPTGEKPTCRLRCVDFVEVIKASAKNMSAAR